ncbi:MAG TPA: YybS family protein [Bacillaceae bacterium]
MKNTRMLTEGALMLAIFVVMLLLSIFVPMAMLITQFFLILPFLLYSSKYPVKHAALLAIGAVLISFMAGSVFGLALGLIYSTTGLMMGYCIRTGKSKMMAFMSSGMVFLVNIVLIYAAAAMFFSMNFIDELATMFKESAEQYTQLMKSVGQTPDPKATEQINEFVGLLGTLAPSLLVGTSFISVILLMVINLPIVGRFGVKVPKFEPFRDFKLPKSILWYYLAALVLTIFLKPEEGTYWFMVLVNGANILQLLLVIQGLALLYFFSHMKKWPKAVPIIATVLIFILPMFLSIVRLLGIIDMGFDLRERLKHKS